MNCPMMTELATAAWLLFLIGLPPHCISTWSHLELQAMETCCLIPFCSVVH